MRGRTIAAGALGLAMALAAARASAQDFDPHGRHKRPPPASHPAPSRGNPPPAARAPGDGASSAALIERYTKIALAKPGDAFPLQRLAQLYRERDGSLKKLVEDFEQRAAGGAQASDTYAATVGLAGLYRTDGRSDAAIATYEKAIALKATDPAAELALAHLLQERGDVDAARTRYAHALTLQTTSPEREQTLHALMALVLDARDWDAAKGYHAELVKLEPASLFVRGELARELFNRGEYERAETELRDLVTASQGDNRALAPALKDLGKALAKEHKNGEAITTLKRALAVAGAEAGVKREVYGVITELYREEQRLPEWVAELEREHAGDFARLALLAQLYEETGEVEKALATYRRALAVNPRQIDERLKMIRLLQSQGELDRAIAEYDGLIRAAPNEPKFVFEECDALVQRGDRQRAMKLLTALEARASGDEDVLAQIAEFYQRIGEGERATTVLARLAATNSNDPSHLVDLGDRYFQDGNPTLALATWKRVLTTVQPRARALAILGDVYLEHDMTADALAALREALQLDAQNANVKKQLANGLERARNYREASQLWTELAAKAKQTNDKTLAREARSHVVTLWGLERILEQQIAPLSAALSANPPDVEAGKTLAEVQIHARHPADAETTLRRVISLAPGDPDPYLALEHVLVQEGKIEEAIKTLEKLVEVDPKRSRELYERMAQYAAQLHFDQRALDYAEHAVALNPDDAEGHRRLAEQYKTQQRTADAIREYKTAIAKNDRLYPVYLELADLLKSRDRMDEADTYYRRVIRGSPDEELVKTAAQASMTLNLGKDTLQSLEQELLPIAIGNPQRPVYRRQLVQTYGLMTSKLVQRVRHAGSKDPAEAKDAEDARVELERIGARAVKPLLDALADVDGSQQLVAIEVLGYVRNKSAGPALFAFATSDAETSFRVRAMTACGALRDPALLPKYEKLLLHDDEVPTDGVALAAAWGVARMDDRRALPILRKLAKRGTPDVRALAILGLGELKDRASARDIAELAAERGAGNVALAAAAYVLGGLGSEADRATLVWLAYKGDSRAREMAVTGLARMPRAADPKEDAATIDALATAVFESGDPESPRMQEQAEAIRRAGTAALVALATKSPPVAHPLDAVDADVDVGAILERVVPRDLTQEALARALVRFKPQIETAARNALNSAAPEAVVDAIAQGEGAFLPFVGPDASDPTVPPEAYEAARAISRDLEAKLVGLAAAGGASALRTRVITMLARSPRKDAEGAVVQALSDPNEGVQRSALAAIGSQPDPAAVDKVRALLATSDNWAMRQLAVQALGRLGAAGARNEASAALRDSATGDPYALVREAALRALASFDPAAARPLARQLAASDPEPRVQDAAREIAGAP